MNTVFQMGKPKNCGGSSDPHKVGPLSKATQYKAVLDIHSTSKFPEFSLTFTSFHTLFRDPKVNFTLYFNNCLELGGWGWGGASLKEKNLLPHGA